MAQITQNNCTVSGLRPLEVICNPTNASSPETQDGTIQLYINGGTSPYTVSWENGAQGTFVNNLQAGEYTATVTDYYGDYTKTITCTVSNNTFYLDEFIKCNDEFNPNIYVFYDGTSLNASAASSASESIRSWYETKKNNGFGGLLYEGVIGAEYLNGENWLWWVNYPYLGSLTGGTLSDGSTVISSFGLSGESVNHSLYNFNWCESNDNGKCVPKTPSFNFGDTVAGGGTSDIYKRINNGFSLTGAYGTNDTRSLGVPFTVTPQMNGVAENIYGNFVGGDKKYICIIVADEANGNVGLYHGDVDDRPPIKDGLFEEPFLLSGIGWSGSTGYEPTNRFEYDYESFLKVWEDIKDQGGSFGGYIYPLIENKISEIPFIQHTVAAIEGTTITELDFEEKYGTTITNVGPQSLNLSALTRTNVYSAMTSTSTYQSLDSQYKNGPGLKNFNWQVNPNVSSFENGIIGNTLNEYFNDIALSTDKIYIEPLSNLTEDRIYKFTNFSGCYSYNRRIISSGEEYSALTISNNYDTCTKCQPSEPNPGFQPTLCLLGGQTQYQFNPIGTDVNDYFVWENLDNSLTLSYNITLNRWEITPWTNVGVGAMVRNVNETIPSGTFVNLGNPQALVWTMSEGLCNGIPLSLSYITSDETCRNSANGSVILNGEGGTPPYQYRIQGVGNYPNYGPAIYNGLTYGNYFAEVEDSNGDTSSVIFTINQGETQIQYNVSLTFNVVSAPPASGLVTYTYGVQVSPALPSNVYLTMKLVTNHTRKYRDSGSATFSQTHTITKNGTLNIPYNTSSTTTSTTPTSCTIEDVNLITEVFTQTTDTITFNSGDSYLGNITQNIPTIDGEDSFCNTSCRMSAEYITSVSVTNLTINGTNCGSASFSNIPVGATSVRIDCFEPQP